VKSAWLIIRATALVGSSGGCPEQQTRRTTEEHGNLIDTAPAPSVIASNSSCQKQADYLIRCIVENPPAQTSTAEEGLEITRVLCALLQSAAESRELKRKE